MLEISKIRNQFPALQREVCGRPIIYLDSAATYLKPQAVIDRVVDCYRNYAGTVGRGAHVLAREASELFQEARETIAGFINADEDEIIFVRNATEAINLVAQSLDQQAAVVGSIGEHHSNLLPWLERGLWNPVRVESDGAICLEDYDQLVKSTRPSLCAVSSISNAFGTVQPLDHIISRAREYGCQVLVDANQSVAHERIDTRQLDCDYLCFSGHKLGGPTGIGVLYVKKELLANLKPRMLGGGAVDSVDENGYELAKIPYRFEAGTPSFESAIGLAAACEFFETQNLDSIKLHEQELTSQLVNRLDAIPRVAVVGPAATRRGSIVSFHVDGLEAHGAARMLSDRANICVRSGFHCAQQAHQSLGMKPTIRASFGMYNDPSEVDSLAETLEALVANLH